MKPLTPKSVFDSVTVDVKPLTMTAEEEQYIREKPRGIPQAHEIAKLLAEIDALRVIVTVADLMHQCTDVCTCSESVARSASMYYAARGLK